MAKKKVTKVIKLQIPAGKANPAPPIGRLLVLQGSRSWHSVKTLTPRRKKEAGKLLPTVITVYHDKSFDFITKQPPASSFL